MFLYFNDLVLNFIAILLVLLQFILYICQKDRDMILLITIGGTWISALVGLIITIGAIREVLRTNKKSNSLKPSGYYFEDYFVPPNPISAEECINQSLSNDDARDRQLKKLQDMYDRHQDEKFLDYVVFDTEDLTGRAKENLEQLLPGDSIRVCLMKDRYSTVGYSVFAYKNGSRLGKLFVTYNAVGFTKLAHKEIIAAYVIRYDKSRYTMPLDVRVYYK